MTENKAIEIWKQFSQPPKWALKQITGGRLKGKTDINPQWRYQAMTEAYGPCGIGWSYEVIRKWTEPGPADQVFAFADINLYIKDGDSWSEAIPGHGGHMLVVKESSGLHPNDEGFKMAITDALSTAMKMLGVGADIYAGLWDGSKYKAQPDYKEKTNQPADGESRHNRLPQITGVTFSEEEGKDGQLYIIAKGDTYNKKSILEKHGFKTRKGARGKWVTYRLKYSKAA